MKDNKIQIQFKNYDKLLKLLKAEMSMGNIKAQEAYLKERVLSYWKMGEIIVNHLLENKRGSYGDEILKRLSEDLKINKRVLHRVTKFYIVYPDIKNNINLAWSHYLALCKIKDEDFRKALEKKAIIEKWSVRMLEEKIKEGKDEKKIINKNKKLKLSRGKLYTYKLKKVDFLKGKYLLDCGFKVYKEISKKLIKFREEEIIIRIECNKRKEPFEWIPHQVRNDTKKDLYCYKARVEKFIDGDTLWLYVDCGFGIWLKEKVRLRGINTEDKNMVKGAKAKRFVEKKLKKLDIVAIKVHYRDKYDRFLVDLFYLPKEKDGSKVLAKGKCINQELLDEGLAVFS